MCFLFFIISFKKHHSFQYFFSCSQFYLKAILKFQQCGWCEFYGYLSWFMKDTCVVSSSLSTLLFCYLDNVWISKWISPVLLVHHSVKIEITLIYFLWSVTHISFNTYLNTVVFFFFLIFAASAGVHSSPIFLPSFKGYEHILQRAL